jgi:hypothetical protein
MELKPLKVQAEIMWAFLDTPNQLSGKYQVDLCNLTKSAVSALEEMGVNVRSKSDQPEKGFFVTAKSLNVPIRAVDVEGNPITVKVGNGSKCVALLNPFHYPAGKGYKAGVGVGVKQLLITDLKVYEGNAVTIDDNVL